ncbi:hypothetical protein PTKIN_Ptkin11bG0158500 [Pterospermum kingtungense]
MVKHSIFKKSSVQWRLLGLWHHCVFICVCVCINMHNNTLLTGFKCEGSDSCTPIAGTKSGAGPAPLHDSTPINPGAVPQAQFLMAKTREESPVNSLDETNKSHKKIGGKCRRNSCKQTQVQSRYLPKINYEEISEICAMYPLTLTFFLFYLPHFLKDYVVVLLFDIRSSIHYYSVSLIF